MIDFMIVKDIGTDLELIAMMLFVIVADSGKVTISSSLKKTPINNPIF